MKYFLFLPAIAFTCSVSCLAQKENTPAPNGAVPSVQQEEEKNSPQWIKDFNSLDEKKRVEYISKFAQAEFLFKQKRIIECLRIAEEIEKIFLGNPGLFNLKGACYIEIRDVPKALACFEEAKKIDPANTSVQFNIAETHFIKHDYAKAAEEFNGILKELPNSASMFVKSLLQFKLYICYLKLNKLDEAAKLEQLYDKMDDVPFYYCVEAVKALNKGNKEAGQASYMSAVTIFQSSGMLQPFSDAMQEAGLLPSMAGQTYTGK